MKHAMPRQLILTIDDDFNNLEKALQAISTIADGTEIEYEIGEESVLSIPSSYSDDDCKQLLLLSFKAMNAAGVAYAASNEERLVSNGLVFPFAIPDESNNSAPLSISLEDCVKNGIELADFEPLIRTVNASLEQQHHQLKTHLDNLFKAHKLSLSQPLDKHLTLVWTQPYYIPTMLDLAQPDDAKEYQRFESYAQLCLFTRSLISISEQDFDSLLTEDQAQFLQMSLNHIALLADQRENPFLATDCRDLIELVVEAQGDKNALHDLKATLSTLVTDIRQFSCDEIVQYCRSFSAWDEADFDKLARLFIVAPNDIFELLRRKQQAQTAQNDLYQHHIDCRQRLEILSERFPTTAPKNPALARLETDLSHVTQSDSPQLQAVDLMKHLQSLYSLGGVVFTDDLSRLHQQIQVLNQIQTEQLSDDTVEFSMTLAKTAHLIQQAFTPSDDKMLEVYCRELRALSLAYDPEFDQETALETLALCHQHCTQQIDTTFNILSSHPAIAKFDQHSPIAFRQLMVMNPGYAVEILIQFHQNQQYVELMTQQVMKNKILNQQVQSLVQTIKNSLDDADLGSQYVLNLAAQYTLDLLNDPTNSGVINNFTLFADLMEGHPAPWSQQMMLALTAVGSATVVVAAVGVIIFASPVLLATPILLLGSISVITALEATIAVATSTGLASGYCFFKGAQREGFSEEMIDLVTKASFK